MKGDKLAEKIKVKNSVLWRLGDMGPGVPGPLTKLGECEGISVKYSLPIARLAKSLRHEIETIGEERNRLIKRHGTAEEGKPASLTADSPRWVEFVREHDELMAMETEVEVTKVTVPEDAKVPPGVLEAMLDFLA